MVTDSYPWLNLVVPFPSNFSRFSIFSCEVRISSLLGPAYCCALATPSDTSCTSSRGEIDVCEFLGGGCGGEGVGRNGGVDGPDGGLDGGPPAAALCGFLHGGGDACLIGINGMAGGCSLRVEGASGSRMGLRKVGQVKGVRGSCGSAGLLVLEGQVGLHHGCGSCGGEGPGAGEPGRGIPVASCRISSRACCRSSSICLTFCWWSAAHNSTLPWKVARC